MLAARIDDLRTRLDAEDDPDRVLLAWAAIARACGSSKAWISDLGAGRALARPFAGIYRLVATFEGDISLLHAEATVIKAMPIVERLVAEHPPVDPTPAGARVHALRPRSD